MTECEYKICKRKGTKNLISAKIYCNAGYWSLGKIMWTAERQRQRYKSLQSSMVVLDAQARTGTIRCRAKTGLG